VPERPFDVEALCARLERRRERGRLSSIVVVSEGAVPVAGPQAEAAELATASGTVDQFGHARLGGIGAWLAREIEERTGYECRETTLGHTQRGGTPTAFDRVLATRFGVEAAHALDEGTFDIMVALQGGQIVRIPLEVGVGRPRASTSTARPGGGTLPRLSPRGCACPSQRAGRPPAVRRPPARGRSR